MIFLTPSTWNLTTSPSRLSISGSYPLPFWAPSWVPLNQSSPSRTPWDNFKRRFDHIVGLFGVKLYKIKIAELLMGAYIPGNQTNGGGIHKLLGVFLGSGIHAILKLSSWQDCLLSS